MRMEDGNRSDIGESGGRRRRIARLAATRSLAYPLPRFVHRLMDNTHLSTTWEEEEQEDLGIKRGRQEHSVVRTRGCVKPA